MIKPALRKLPGVTCLHPLRPQHITRTIGDNNTYVGSIALCIYQNCFNPDALQSELPAAPYSSSISAA